MKEKYPLSEAKRDICVTSDIGINSKTTVVTNIETKESFANANEAFKHYSRRESDEISFRITIGGIGAVATIAGIDVISRSNGNVLVMIEGAGAITAGTVLLGLGVLRPNIALIREQIKAIQLAIRKESKG
jgi:hypothetical protein